jgi:hypothetical protein
MAEAARSLPRNGPSLHIAGAAVTLALYRARHAVKDAVRRKGESSQRIRAATSQRWPRLIFRSIAS